MRLRSQNLVGENQAVLLSSLLLPFPVIAEISEIRGVHSGLDPDKGQIPDRAVVIWPVDHLGIRSESNRGDNKTHNKHGSIPHRILLLFVEIGSPVLLVKRDRSSRQE